MGMGTWGVTPPCLWHAAGTPVVTRGAGAVRGALPRLGDPAGRGWGGGHSPQRGAETPTAPLPELWGCRGRGTLGLGGTLHITRDRRCLPLPTEPVPDPPTPYTTPPKPLLPCLWGGRGAPCPVPSLPFPALSQPPLARARWKLSPSCFYGRRGRGWPGRGYGGGRLCWGGAGGLSPSLCHPLEPPWTRCLWQALPEPCGGQALPSPHVPGVPAVPGPGEQLGVSAGGRGAWGWHRCDVGLSPIPAGSPQASLWGRGLCVARGKLWGGRAAGAVGRSGVQRGRSRCHGARKGKAGVGLQERGLRASESRGTARAGGAASGKKLPVCLPPASAALVPSNYTVPLRASPAPLLRCPSLAGLAVFMAGSICSAGRVFSPRD